MDFQEITTRMTIEYLSKSTTIAYITWIKKLSEYYPYEQIEDLSPKQVENFLSSLVDENVARSTQKQAFFAMKYLYDFLGRPLPKINAKRSTKPPVTRWALTQDELNVLFSAIESESMRLSAKIMYGSGLRVSECAALRIKDVDLDRRTIMVRDGKNHTDRLTILPKTLVNTLEEYFLMLKRRHVLDISNEIVVPLPYALSRKYPAANKEFHWAWIFPGRVRKGERNHISVAAIQKAIKKAGEKACPGRKVTCHYLRHTFATHYVYNGGRIDDLKEIMGHKSAETTCKYLHPVNNIERLKSPMDGI